MESKGKIAVDQCSPAGRKPAPRAGTVKQKDGGAGGKAKLLVGSVQVRIRSQKGGDHRYGQPNHKPCGLG